MVASVLKQHNLKVTPQRLAIFGALSNTTSHPTAEEIYTVIQSEFPTMSLATVYKTLDTFVKSNLIQQLNVGENSFRYDATTLSHPHIICTNCSVVVDLENFMDLDFTKINTDFEITYHKLFLYGLCPTCKVAHQD
ncbi:MAG: transcriptional repressor [Epulopiscium sp. Nuni2H_MBin003]|nr:MAG: transcriptional repressor [Epulopiscium sp. Nuni2H_MBin003]